LAVFAVALGQSQPALAQTGLLLNPSFEDGYLHQDDIPELAMPNHWWLHYLDGATFPGIAEGYVAARPETVVWNIKDAPHWERGLFFLDGSYTVKIFKPWMPMYAALSQDVSGLQPGAEYEWSANVFVDVVDHYTELADKVAPNNEPEGVRVRLGVSPVGARWRESSQITYGPWFHAGNTQPFHQTFLGFRKRFVATSPEMTVWVEMASSFGYANNGFFMDSFSLKPVAPAAPRADAPTATPVMPATTAPIADPPAATPVPQASVPTVAPAVIYPSQPTAAPTEPPAPASPAAEPSGPIVYTIQRGDTLYKIARAYGVSLTEIARLNNMTNTWRIYPGQVIQIPVAGQAAVVAPTQAPVAASGQPIELGNGARTYTVRYGDTLYRIAQAYGLTTAQLADANGIADPRFIYAGQVLVIP
jgi:LysM repeat protein